MNTLRRASVHLWLVVAASSALAIAHGAAPTQPSNQRPTAPVTTRAQYVANASVLVIHGDTKVVFDPLYRNDFGQHRGDADTSDAHFARDGAYWQRRRTNVAFPPYWFLMGDEGRRVLEQRIGAARSIGVHVPANVPGESEKRAPELRGQELFTMPGEVREIR